ncbi:MAG: hypothetical protein SLAVMIC_00836 [uncultured marine phage]|uniref:Uncharacterized protein n=1 Tax=uncultured marine phage TaxID=707152 RepID=A0A8D9FR48_9VIRU|nr:MAG: hypothetical protein SLAVMIC_00836 [uncultured marine phage]
MKINRSLAGNIVLENFRTDTGINGICVSSGDLSRMFTFSQSWTLSAFEELGEITIIFDENQSVYRSKDGSEVLMVNNYRNRACVIKKDYSYTINRKLALHIIENSPNFKGGKKLEQITFKSN